MTYGFDMASARAFAARTDGGIDQLRRKLDRLIARTLKEKHALIERAIFETIGDLSPHPIDHRRWSTFREMAFAPIDGSQTESWYLLDRGKPVRIIRVFENATRSGVLDDDPTTYQLHVDVNVTTDCLCRPGRDFK